MNIHLSATTVAVAAAFPFFLSTPALAATEGETLVVTATRTPTPVNELLSDLTVLERDAIEQAGQSTLAEFLASQAGVQFSQAGGPGTQTGIYLRGGAAGHTLILIDGMRTGSATLGEPSPQNIPLSQIERIEILRGPASALYGSDAIGGVIQIFTRRGEAGPARLNAFAGVGSYGLRETSVGVSGGDSRWIYSVSGGYAESDGFSARRKAVADPDHDGHRNSNFAGSVSFRPAAGHEIGASLLYSDTRTWYDNSFSATPADIHSNSEISTLSVHTRNRLTDSWESTLRHGRSIDKGTDRFSAFLPESNFETIQDQTVWQNDIRLPVGRLLLGYEHLKQQVDTDQEIAVDERTTDSVLVGWQGSFGKHRLQANARHDDNSGFDDKATGSIAYGYQLTERLRMHASYGTSFSAPTFNDLYWPEDVCPAAICGETYITRGNPNIKPEEGRNRELAMHWEGESTTASVTYFNNKVRNLIDWQSTRPVPGVNLLMPANVSAAKLEGVSMSASSEVGVWRASATLDFLRARDEETGDHLQRRADRSATLRLARSFGALSLGGEVLASSYRYSKNANIERLSGYAIANVFARYAVDRDWSIEGRVNNVFDKDYELIKDYNTPRANAFIGVRYAPK
ncbi:MAG: TonB-dependent receptor [Aromatoleum sp.]|jgi:vitamin B12 transporter|uniref:TonB-dependent receptor domain-containing protein n=1 Tax=Aromatoleum sp. TaxID=2307007 RepID=UPI002894642F|nr:TonB-dependent receptor [Aromatoleum sp.]MDT3670418.1 TonB-dependent receptor [Aromatoleum sp.]